MARPERPLTIEQIKAIARGFHPPGTSIEVVGRDSDGSGVLFQVGGSDIPNKFMTKSADPEIPIVEKKK